MGHVAVSPDVLRWACERSGRDTSELARRFPLAAWESGQAQPTIRQLDDFARATLTPVGYLYLSTPPDEELPIADLRTMGAGARRRPTAALLDTLYLCERRQDWYADYLREQGEEPLAFVGSASLDQTAEPVAAAMREQLGFSLADQLTCRDSEETLTRLADRAEEVGVLVMRNGIVRNNTHWPLNPEEFRGFALVDPLAPLIFVNAADAKAAQLFTLAHELAHIWLGQSALSNTTAAAEPSWPVEAWCNRVAAEFLVPAAELRAALDKTQTPEHEVERLARVYKVSRLVTARRLRDVGEISGRRFEAIYDAETARFAALKRVGGGGNFYASQRAKVGAGFARAVIASAFGGHTLLRDAQDMLAMPKMSTFTEFGRQLGLGV